MLFHRVGSDANYEGKKKKRRRRSAQKEKREPTQNICVFCVCRPRLFSPFHRPDGSFPQLPQSIPVFSLFIIVFVCCESNNPDPCSPVFENKHSRFSIHSFDLIFVPKLIEANCESPSSKFLPLKQIAINKLIVFAVPGAGCHVPGSCFLVFFVSFRILSISTSRAFQPNVVQQLQPYNFVFPFRSAIFEKRPQFLVFPIRFPSPPEIVQRRHHSIRF